LAQVILAQASFGFRSVIEHPDTEKG